MSVTFLLVCGELIQDPVLDMLNSGLLAWLSCEPLAAVTPFSSHLVSD